MCPDNRRKKLWRNHKMSLKPLKVRNLKPLKMGAGKVSRKKKRLSQEEKVRRLEEAIQKIKAAKEKGRK